MAGPSGTKLIDLHMTDRGQTSEMWTPSRPLGADSPLRKDADLAAHDKSTMLANAGRSLVVFLVHLVVLCLSFLIAQTAIETLQNGGIDLIGAMSAIGAEGVTFGMTVLVAAGALGLLEVSGALRTLRQTLKFSDPPALDKDTTAADLMKIKPTYIHFGHLPVTYDITEKGLLIRSLGDRFVAVLSLPPDATVKLAPDPVEASYRGWYGDELTPPVVIEVEEGAYKSKLLISGFHFETPKAGNAHSSKRAEAFLDALKHRPACSHGDHDDHH